MDTTSEHRPRTLLLLAGLMAVQGLSAVAGGYGLASDPTGRAIGIPVEWLAGSPFHDFLVPGLFLLIVLGIGPLVVTWGLWRRRRWAWAGSLLVAAVLLAWLAVEIAVIGYVRRPPFQAMYAALAVALLGLAFTPSVRGGLLRS